MVKPNLNGIAKKYVENLKESRIPEEPKPLDEVIVEMIACIGGYSRVELGWVKQDTFVNLDEMR